MRIASALVVVFFVTLPSCASTSHGRAEPPLDPSECAAIAAGIGPDGRSTMVESFDTLFSLAQAGEEVHVLGPGNKPLSRKPELINRQHVAAVMQQNYPRLLSNAQRGGHATVAFLVHPDGTPRPIRILRSSRVLELDAATVLTVQQMRFSPGEYRGCPVTVFVAMPVTWQPTSRARNPN